MESRPYHNSSAIQFHCFRYACEKYDNTTLFHRKSHFWRRKSRDTLLFANDANQSFNSTLTVKDIAREQAFRGALGWGGKGRRPCKTTSLEFEYLHRENRCEILIGEDDITNDVITSFGTCFPMFVYIRARYCFALIGGNLTTASHRGIGGWIEIPKT